MSTAKPTTRQRRAFNILVDRTMKGEKPSRREILAEAGYNKISHQPSRIWDSKGFQSLLATINDQNIVLKIEEILNSDDKRSALTAADMLLKLKGRYPDHGTKMVGLFAKIGELDDGQ